MMVKFQLIALICWLECSKLKLKELLEDITIYHVLGKVVAEVHGIEFQKRGLPHCHILIHLHPGDKVIKMILIG